MRYVNARWVPGISTVMLLACTEAMHVGNEPVQVSEMGGSSGAATTATTQTPGGSTGAPATVVAEGGAPATNPGCAADPMLTAAQMEAVQAAACNAWAVEPEMTPTRFGLVVDVSSSMAEPATGEGASKWDVTRSALADVLLGSPSSVGLPASASVGLLLYPNQPNFDSVPTSPTDVSTCLNVAAMTPAEPLGGDDVGSHRRLLRQRLNEAVLGRGTPTHDAYDYALHHMMLTAESANIPGERSMLLITDGSPSYYKGCHNPSGQVQELAGDPIVASVQYARSVGMRTFVIGVPGSEAARAWLSKAAHVGGTATAGCAPEDPNGPYCHSDLTGHADFTAALRVALAKTNFASISCRFEIPTQSADGMHPVDPSRIVPIVRLADGSVMQLQDNTNTPAGCNSGFRFVDASEIEISPTVCRWLDGNGATMQLLFGCTPGEITAGLM